MLRYYGGIDARHQWDHLRPVAGLKDLSRIRVEGKVSGVAKEALDRVLKKCSGVEVG